jgi:hypothetical protein
MMEIFIPEGVVIDLTALPGAELLTGASSQCWGDALPPVHRMGSQRVVCRDRETLLTFLGLALTE